ncbi:glycosyltransferase family 4 protein [Candidatus Uhrbacteria bacterium]|nr:glycosyltransferase family 4 protein [Candidatus Uhrbacteria bacterium]
MKIAMIGQKGIPARAGGIERHVEELSAELAARGHEVLVFCRSWYVWPIRNHRGVRCIKTPTIATKHLDAIIHTFTSIVRAAYEKVDVFHIHGVGPALLAWLPKLLRPSAKVIVTFHCIDRHHQKWGWFARTMLALGERSAVTFPDATIAVSKTLETYCRMSYGTNAKYIPNGTQIPQADADPAVVQGFGLEPGKYLMMCSRLVKHKGAHLLIDAWKRLVRERPDLTRGLKLAIVGGSAFTDDYVKKLRRMAQGDDSIVLTGTQTGSTLHALFLNSYACVHPSESEGLPIAVLEAMSYGKCVLSSDIPENLELTENYGLSFRRGSITDLKAKMIELLENPEDVREIGKRARAHISKTYDWKDIAETTEYLYELIQLEPQLKDVAA